MKKFTFLALLFILFNINNLYSQTLSEDFEQADIILSSYAGLEVNLQSGKWYIKGITGMDDKDRYNGTTGVRLRGNGSDVDHRLEMLFDKPNGIGTVSFKYGSYSTHTNGKIQLYTSDDQGATWVIQGSEITVQSWLTSGQQLSTASIAVNIQGDARIKIVKKSATGNTTLCIDDIEITDYSGGSTGPEIITDKNSIDYGNVVIGSGSVPVSLDISGNNLTDFLTYMLMEDGGIADAFAFAIDKTNYNKQTGGTIVIYFEPNMEKDYAVKLKIVSDGAADVVIPIRGSGVASNPLLSSDATLADLQIDQTSIQDFAPEQFEYLHILPEGYTGLPVVTPVANDVNASVDFVQPQSIPATVDIEVTAEDGITILQYSLTIKDQASVSSDATLATLQIDGVDVPGFSPQTFNYSYMFPSGYNNIPLITATAAASTSTVRLGQPLALPADIAVKVTAEDGTLNTYRLHLRPYHEEPIANYILNGGFENWRYSLPRYWNGSQTDCALVQALDSHNGLYAVELINTTSTDKIFSTEDINISQGNGYEISFWVKGKGDIRTGLYPGAGGQVIFNPVISHDSNEWTQYTQTIRPGDTAADAQFCIAVKNTDGLLLDDVFVFDYSIVEQEITTDLAAIDFGNVYFNETSEAITLTVSSNDLSEAIVYSITGADAAFFDTTEGTDWNSASGGDLLITFSPDDLRDYSATLNLTSEGALPVAIPLTGRGVEPSAIATLANIKINGVDLPGFLSDTYFYRYMLPEADGSQAVIAVTPTDEDATVILTQPASIPALVVIDVTSPDGQVNLQYTIRIVPHFEEAQGNHIANGGFELWNSNIPVGWNGSETTGAAAFALSEDAHSGFYAVELIRASTGARFIFSTQSVNILDNYRYQLSYWVKGVGSIAVGHANEIDGITLKPARDINSNDWTQYTDLIEPGVTSNLNEFLFSFNSTNGLFVDEVTVTPVRILYPETEADKTSLDFGSVYVGDNSLPQEVVVTGIDLSQNISHSITGADASCFSVTEENWNNRTGGTLSVKFAPTEAKTYNVSLVISQPEVTNISIPITGSGQAKSSDSGLSTIMVDGQAIPGFVSSTISYDYIVPLSITTVPSITVQTTQSNATYNITDATAIPGTTTIEVTAHDGTTTVYEVNFIRSSDNFLSSIKIDNVQLPDFSPAKTDYQFMLDKDYPGLPQVTAIARDAANGASVLVPAFSTLPATIPIEAKAADNSTKTYTLRIVPHYEEPAGNFIADGGFELWDNTTTLTRWGGSRTNTAYAQSTDSYEGFYALGLINNTAAAERFSSKTYAVTYDYGYTISFRVKGHGEIALGVYDGASDNLNAYSTIASDTWTTHTRDVFPSQTTSAGEFIFAVRNTAGLSLDNVVIAEYRVLHPAISANKESLDFANTYALDTSSGITITISTVDLTQPLAYAVEGTDRSAFPVTETSWSSADGGTLSLRFKPTEAKNYTATLVFSSSEINNLSIPLMGTGIARRTDASLANLLMDGEPFEGFDTDTHAYDTLVYKAYSGIPVITAELSDAGASCNIVPATAIPGSTQVVVTAHDKVTQQTYTVNFVRSTVSTLKEISIDGIELPDFSPDVQDYTYMLPDYAAAMPVITAVPTIAGAQVLFNPPTALPELIQIRVVAEDDITETTYTIRLLDYYEEPWNNSFCNGGFESWTDDLPDCWMGNATTMETSVISETSDSHGGYLAVALKHEGDNPVNFSTKPLSIVEDLEYQISFYAKGTGEVRTGFYYGSGNGFEYNNYLSISSVEWTQYTQTITTAYNGTAAELILSFKQADLIIDDVMMIPINGEVEPVIVGNRQEVDFGEVYMQETADVEQLIVAGINLTDVMSYELEGEQADVFVLDEIDWQPGSRGAFNVSFAPDGPGEYEAEILFSSDGETLYTVALKGTSLARHTDATLADILIDDVLIEGFDPEKTEYTLIIPLSYTGIPNVKATAVDGLADVDITQAGAIPGEAVIVVTAHDDTITKTYKVNFLRSDVAVLLDLQMDGTTIEGFDPTVYDYYIILPDGYTGIPQFAATVDDEVNGAQVLFSQPQRVPHKVVFTVQAADGITEVNYSVSLSYYSEDHSANLILNGSFEFWYEDAGGNLLPDHWFGSKTSMGVAAVVISDDAVEGYHSAELINTVNIHKRLSTVPVSVGMNELYQITFSAKGYGDIRTALYDGRDEDDGYFYNEYIRINSAEWEVYTQFITAETTTDLAEFIFSMRNTQSLFIDDVIIQVVSNDSINTLNPDNIYAYHIGNKVVVENIPVHSLVNVYDMGGVLVEGKRAASSKAEFVLPARGVYLITISSERINKSLKVIYR